VVAFAAISAAPTNPTGHFTLGAIYAMVGDYNLSAMCLMNALKLQPKMKSVSQLLRAVRCTSKLEHALEAQHSSLQRTLSELRYYQKRHETLQKNQEKLLTEQAPPEDRIQSQLVYEELKLGHRRRVEKCVKTTYVSSDCGKHQHIYSTLGLGVRIQLLFTMGAHSPELDQLLQEVGSEHVEL